MVYENKIKKNSQEMEGFVSYLLTVKLKEFQIVMEV
jgi:hypothetical protein